MTVATLTLDSPFLSAPPHLNEASAKSRRAIFLDRDGVLNEDPGFVHLVRDLKLLPTVAEGFAALKSSFFRVVTVSNQSGIAHGKFNQNECAAFNEAIAARLNFESGFAPEAFYICPHHPQGLLPEFTKTCLCRKPGTALIQRASREFGIDLNSKNSFFIGDRDTDIECAIRAQLIGVQIRSDERTDGRGQGDCFGIHPQAAAVVDDFISAVRWILAQH